MKLYLETPVPQYQYYRRPYTVEFDPIRSIQEFGEKIKDGVRSFTACRIFPAVTKPRKRYDAYTDSISIETFEHIYEVQMEFSTGGLLAVAKGSNGFDKTFFFSDFNVIQGRSYNDHALFVSREEAEAYSDHIKRGGKILPRNT